MLQTKSTTFYCFSPPVMLATFAIEIGFALYILWRYKLTNISRLVVAILVCLAAFQGSEYLICGGANAQPGLWSKLGYGAITLLPPLGIHLALTIARKRNVVLLSATYATAIAFLAYFAFFTQAITGQTCYANYVVFSGGTPATAWLYSLYYYGWLLTGVYISLKYAKGSIKHSLRALATGYGAFIIPTTLVNVIDPSTIAGIPSIMCGFAVILAFVLTLKVVPSSVAKQSQTRRRLKRIGG